MCGIAGLIHRGKSSDVGSEMTSMLQSLKHRGPDSTGFALYFKYRIVMVSVQPIRICVLIVEIFKAQYPVIGVLF